MNWPLSATIIAIFLGIVKVISDYITSKSKSDCQKKHELFAKDIVTVKDAQRADLEKRMSSITGEMEVDLKELREGKITNREAIISIEAEVGTLKNGMGEIKESLKDINTKIDALKFDIMQSIIKLVGKNEQTH